MLGAVDEIANQVDSRPVEQWIEDRTRVAAASMYLIVLGEGAQNLSAERKALAPEIPRADIGGMRHRLAHGYFRADRRVIWEAATLHTPALKPSLQRLLQSLGPETD